MGDRPFVRTVFRPLQIDLGARYSNRSILRRAYPPSQCLVQLVLAGLGHQAALAEAGERAYDAHSGSSQQTG